jgi:acyl-CoA thioesterase
MSSTAFPFDIPFLDEVGVEYLGMEGGKSQVALNLEPRHMNSWQVTHGGVVMTLLDVAMAMAGRSLDAESRPCVTVEMKTSFLQPSGKPGHRLVASGHAFHRSTTLCFCEADLHDGDRLVAKAMGTFKYIKHTTRLDISSKPTSTKE